MTAAHSLQWWTFESDPVAEGIVQYTHDPETGAPNGFELVERTDGYVLPPDVPKDGPLPDAVGERLLRLVDEDFDAGSCEANGCGAPVTPHPPPRLGTPRTPSPNAVGYGLYGEADEHTAWTWATIVLLTNGKTVVVCEDCDPHVIYEQEAPA